MISFLLRVAILLVIAFAYAMFDIFNKRNVPDVFVYASLIIGVIVTLTYDTATMEVSLLMALIIGALGYVLFRKGLVGAGDFFEFATISLLLPLQPMPILSNVQQFGFPFIFSVFIATGYAAVVGMVVYYLLRAHSRGYLRLSELSRAKLYQAFGMFVAYLLLLAFISYFAGIRLVAVVLILIVALASALTIIFEKAISRQMISYVSASRLTNEDMIATNAMSKSDLEFFSKKSKHFGRLVTNKLIQDLRGVRRKIPLYTSGVPLAFFAFIAVVVSLLFGNILLYVII
jgi:hypothetical protein